MDDIFAIFDTKKCNIVDFLNRLNNQVATIKFTHEKEQLSLDALVSRDKNLLEFDRYRKEYSTLSYILSDHCAQHKMAGLNES